MSVDTAVSRRNLTKHKLLVLSRTWGWGWEMCPKAPQFYLKVCKIFIVIWRLLWIKRALVVMTQYFHLGVLNQHS